MSIAFTQYLRPNGRAAPVSIDMSPETEALAAELGGAGYRFEIEVLRTGDVSMDCSRGPDDVLAIEVVPNGPAVVEAVERLVVLAHAMLEKHPELRYARGVS
jgi:hypothetical protein